MSRIRRALAVAALATTASAGAAALPARADFIPDRPSLDRALVVPAVARRDDLSDASLISAAGAYPSVGRITAGGLSGSGVLIAPNVVLTAAHVLATGVGANQYQFTVGGNTYTGLASFLAPTWTNFNDSIGKGDDIAILTLTSSVTNVTPATLYTGSNEVGRVGTAVGFGYSGTGSAGQSGGGLGSKRAGSNVIDTTGTYFSDVSGNILMNDFDNPNGSTSTFGDASALANESIITQGDSGGGTFIDLGTGPVLVGIHSFLADYNNDGKLADYGDLSGSTRVSGSLAFIGRFVAVPEPPSLSLLGLGALGVLAALRRSRARGG